MQTSKQTTVSACVIMIGIGPNAVRTYLPFFKKYKIKLACVVELESAKDTVESILRKHSLNPVLILVPDKNRDNKKLPFTISSKLRKVISENDIRYAVINSEPKSHFAYLNCFSKLDLQILTEKPIFAPVKLSEYEDPRDVLKMYDKIFKNLQENPNAHCGIMCQRRLHYGYEHVMRILKETVSMYNIPVTEIYINHCDGNWMMPHDLFYENHPYQYGYGKMYHSGYHFIDLLAQIISVNSLVSDDKRIKRVNVCVDSQLVKDELVIINSFDYRSLFKVDKLPDSPRQSEYLNFDDFGEKNIYSQFSFRNDLDHNITVAQLSITQIGFSRRGWIVTKDDHYKGNGRVKHEYVHIQVGPLLNIRIHSYQSKECSERGAKENESGGLDHFDIEIFRNSEIIGGKPYEHIDYNEIIKDRDTFGRHELNEIARERILLSFFNNKIDEVSGYNKHRLGTQFLVLVSNGIIDRKKGKVRIRKTDIELDSAREGTSGKMVRDLLSRLKESDNIAIKEPQKQITYKQWHEASLRLASPIKNSCSTEKSNVILCLPNSIDYAVAYFAVLYAGKVIVPVAPESSEAELGSLIEYCESEIIITNSLYYNKIQNICENLEQKKIIINVEANRLISDHDSNILAADNEDDVFIMLHTSGTMSDPKRVMLTNKNVIKNVESHIHSLDINDGDKTLIVLPMFFGYCNTSQFLTHLYVEGTIVIFNGIFHPSQLRKIVLEEGITNFTAVPSLLTALANEQSQRLKDLPLRYICFGGGRTDNSVIETLIRTNPHIGFVHTYGQTECSPRVTALLPRDALRKIGSVGIPIPGVEVCVMSPSGVLLGTGECGEVCVKGDNVMKGYYKKEELTTRIIKDHWLHTGDEGYLDDEGYLYICGRIKNIIICNGMNIYPEEIEEVLLSHGSVADVRVYGIEHPIYGEIPAAEVVLKEKLSIKEIQSFCKKHLSAYKIPKVVDFVEEIEKTYNGKIKRR